MISQLPKVLQECFGNLAITIMPERPAISYTQARMDLSISQKETVSSERQEKLLAIYERCRSIRAVERLTTGPGILLLECLQRPLKVHIFDLALKLLILQWERPWHRD